MNEALPTSPLIGRHADEEFLEDRGRINTIFKILDSYLSDSIVSSGTSRLLCNVFFGVFLYFKFISPSFIIVDRKARRRLSSFKLLF